MLGAQNVDDKAKACGGSRDTRRVFSICVAFILSGCNGRLNESTSIDQVDGGAPGAATGASSAGAKCGPTPTQLVDFNVLAAQVNGNAITGVQLTVDATNVYFVFDGTVMRVPLRGGPASAMLSLTPKVVQTSDPVATSTHLLLHSVMDTGSNEQIISVPTAGGPAKTLATTNGPVVAFTASETAVYFVDTSGVQSVPVTGGRVQVLTDAIATSATGLAIVGANLVVTASELAGSGAGTVYSLPIQGGSMATLATQQQSASFPLACGSDVCWWTGAPPSAVAPTGPGYIARLAGAKVTTISAPVYPWSLAFDGLNFFETVGCDICPGSLVRIAPSGAPAITMTTAAFVAVDDECVYFSVAEGDDLPSVYDGGIADSGIYSVAKSYADPLLQPGM